MRCGIICGGRFSKDMIRSGESNSFVELALYLPNNELSIDNNIIVSREINLNGRNLCKINGRLVTVNELREFMKNIIDIHSQFDNQTLMDKSYHTKYLDSFIGNKMSDLKKMYINLFSQYKEIKEKLNNNYGNEQEKQRKLDLLKYQLNEINIASLDEKEEEQLAERRNIIINAERVSENLNIVDNKLNNVTIDSVSESIRALEKIETVDKKYGQKLIELKNIYYEIQELSRDIYDLKDNIDFDEEERNNTESRLDIIYTLKMKYGNSIKEILEYAQSVEKEINKIEHADEENCKLKAELEKLINEMTKVANEITVLRENNSRKLNDKINNELCDLDMKNATFDARVIKSDKFTENGLSSVEFLISTNIGEEKKSLNKIASGGEMARIMLAIKNALAEVDEVSVLVFDEIDIGISGKAANMVGEKLRKIANNHQVLIVTHLAPIAAKGEYNYYIYKETANDKTKTKIKQLNEEETIKEIARIASGNITDISLSHAQELRKINVA